MFTDLLLEFLEARDEALHERRGTTDRFTRAKIRLDEALDEAFEQVCRSADNAANAAYRDR